MFKVNVDKIENAACWDELAKVDDETTAPQISHSSSDITNLWSSFRDSHAQVQQKVQYFVLFLNFI